MTKYTNKYGQSSRELERSAMLKMLKEKIPEMLDELENLFGPRNPEFEVGCIKEAEKTPHIFFCKDSSNTVDICLTRCALESGDFKWMHWQLAHECVHLIDPHEYPTNFLEEGLATWYQNHKVPEKSPSFESYKQAESLVLPYTGTLENIGPLPRAIKRIRKEEKVAIGDIEAEVLISYCLEMNKKTADELTCRFEN